MTSLMGALLSSVNVVEASVALAVMASFAIEPINDLGLGLLLSSVPLLFWLLRNVRCVDSP